MTKKDEIREILEAVELAENSPRIDFSIVEYDCPPLDSDPMFAESLFQKAEPKKTLGRLVSWLIFIALPFIMQFVDWEDDDGPTVDIDIHLAKFLTVSVHEFIIPLDGKLGLVDVRWGVHFEKERWHTFEYA